MDQDYKFFALVEFGDCDKDGYVMVKGSDTVALKTPTKAFTYWYPDDITNEEAQQEVKDLMEHYDNVAILTPLLPHISIDILAQRPESEVSANGTQ